MRGLIGKRLDYYQIVAEVGQGGMATVYRAVDSRNNEEVALKVLSPTIAGDRRFIKRFRREGSLLARMDHPHIVPVEDYGECDGFVYLAMPFIQGRTLAARLKSDRIGLSDVIRWIQQVADALDYAHSLGIVHRDVKPSNIIIDEKENAQLTDFGLARQAEGSNTLTGSMLLGTPAYMSPEQAQGEPVEAASDQYSLGVILYQVFTGRLPFDQEAPMATVMMHINEPVPRPRRFNASISEPVEQVILKSLAKKPSYRYSTVGALNLALQAALKGESSSMETQVISPSPGRTAHPAARPEKNYVKSGFRMLWIMPVVVTVAAGVLWLLFRWNGAGSNNRDADENLPSFTTQVPELSDSIQTEVTEAVLVPTEAPTPVKSDTCPGLSMLNFQRSDSTVSWSVDNGKQQPVQLLNVALLVPQDNWLVSMTLDKDILIEMDPFTPPDSDAGLQIPQDERTVIPAGKTVSLELRYAFSDTQPGYGLELRFDGDCKLETGW